MTAGNLPPTGMAEETCNACKVNWAMTAYMALDLNKFGYNLNRSDDVEVIYYRLHMTNRCHA